jgi:hypothetical protein
VATFQNSDGSEMGSNTPRRAWAFVPSSEHSATAVRRVVCASCGGIEFLVGKRASICWVCFRRDWNLAMRQRGQQIREAFAVTVAA